MKRIWGKLKNGAKKARDFLDPPEIRENRKRGIRDSLELRELEKKHYDLIAQNPAVSNIIHARYEILRRNGDVLSFFKEVKNRLEAEIDLMTSQLGKPESPEKEKKFWKYRKAIEYLDSEINNRPIEDFYYRG